MRPSGCIFNHTTGEKSAGALSPAAGRELETERKPGARDGENAQKILAFESGGHAMLAAAALIADLMRG